MTDTRWIVIPLWEQFQHRDVARSENAPPWIKTYTRLQADDDFIALSYHLRGVLLSLWIEYAISARQVSDNTAALTRRLGHRVMRRDLDALNHAGFIEFSASKPPADGQQPASLDKSRKNPYVSKGSNATGGGAPPAAKAAAPRRNASGDDPYWCPLCTETFTRLKMSPEGKWADKFSLEGHLIDNHDLTGNAVDEAMAKGGGT